MSFLAVLNRLKTAADGRPGMQSRAVVERRDLGELLMHFHRLDQEARVRHARDQAARQGVLQAHVICCNDSVEHVVLGSEDKAKEKLEELAKAHFAKWHDTYAGCGLYSLPDKDPYEAYRKRLYWHIHTVSLTEAA